MNTAVFKPHAARPPAALPATARATVDRPPEHEFEAAHGLPELLPADERLLWQGAPDAWAIAREALHVRGIGLYFGVLLAWRAATVLGSGGSVGNAAAAVVWLLPLAVAGLGLLGVIGWLIARTSVYTITDRRIVMRIGIVLSVTFNLPFRQIQSVGLKTRADGSGDLTLLLDDSAQIAYLHLWPHARPWQVRRSQPMLRCIRAARKVAELLTTTLRASIERSAADDDEALPHPTPQRIEAITTTTPAPTADAQARPLPQDRKPQPQTKAQTPTETQTPPQLQPRRQAQPEPQPQRLAA